MLTEHSVCAQIRHENLRIAVIEPLESSLGILPHESTSAVSERVSEEDDDVGEGQALSLSLIHISEPTRPTLKSRMPSSA